MLKQHHGLTSKEITHTILDDVQKFSAQGAHSDDKTIVTIKRII
jgi:serine phosphatase RsbU (regulator of sigma subunit)